MSYPSNEGEYQEMMNGQAEAEAQAGLAAEQTAKEDRDKTLDDLHELIRFNGYLAGIEAAMNLVPEHMLDLRIRILQLGQSKK